MVRRLLLALLLALPAAAQIALKAHTAGQSSTDQPFALPSINSTGASVVLVCETGYTQTSAPTDNLGNTYTRVSSVGSDANASLWAAFAPVTSVSHIITVNGYYPAGAAAAYSGVASGPDQLSTYVAYSYDPTSLGPVTPANNNELVFTCMGMSGGYAGTVDAPVTILDTSGNGVAVTATQIQTTATTVNPTWHPSSGSGYSAITATFYSTQTPAPFTMATTALPEAFGGSVYSYQLRAAGGVSPATWTKTGTLPSGWTLSSGGLLSSNTTIPATASSSPNLVFTATDSQGFTASTSPLTLTVAAAPLAIPTTSCPSGTQGTPYAGCTTAATGGTPPYAFAWSTGSDAVGLPEGLTQSTSSGAIAGTPTGQGEYDVAFTVTDAAGASASRTIPLPIAGNNTAAAALFFPLDHFFHGVDISHLPVDTSPAARPTLPGALSLVGGHNVANGGIPITFVPGSQPYIPIVCTDPCYASGATSGPFSTTTAIEGTANAYASNGDTHGIVVQPAYAGQPAKLFDTWRSFPSTNPAAWNAVSTDEWDLSGPNAYSWVNGRVSADAAGLPIGAMIPTYDEVMSPGGYKRLTRAAFRDANELHYYVWPASTQGGYGGQNSCTGGFQDTNGNYLLSQSNPPTSCGPSPTNRIPIGEIYRIKASYAASPSAACLTNTATNPQAASLFRSWQRYGIINADLGSFPQYITTADDRWDDADLACLGQIPGSAWEPVNVSSLIYTDSSGIPLSLKVRGAVRPPPILNNLLPLPN